MKTFDDIVAYVYKAEIVCPKCIRTTLLGENDKVPKGKSLLNSEQLLDMIAERGNIDRYDEYSFDSDFFPKVVFNSDGDFGHEHCSVCQEMVYK